MPLSLSSLSASMTLPRRAHQPGRVLVMGSEDLAARVRETAGGCEVTTWAQPVAGATLPDDLLADVDELVIERPIADALRATDPDVLLRARCVRVVEPGDAGRAVAADPLPDAGRLLKRAMDVVGATALLLLTLPLLVVAIVAVKLDSPGPGLFIQERVGRNGRRFRLLKLRTMKTGNSDAEHLAYVAAMIRGEAAQQDGVFKLVADPRVTRLGRVLRKLSIDELPQLWNVVKGEMSLVGPRPPMPTEVALYDARTWERLRVRPGLTGLWQVSGRNEVSFAEMVDLDIRYWNSWSVATELRILLRTPAAVLSTRKAA